ncbi:olfactory receptor 2T10-like [Megalops cyprinoides]|uniref:olfactory receptor 2T10-like n=1 Tax=Megalops cyprinoides TaxID=118141 RepID=UPI0018647A05|nr:olfactory receptor 2T10-like [Megalops cyprinoides]XP_036405046.1 olfactory receptor 2T10-like [Megalops cyprinoides]
MEMCNKTALRVFTQMNSHLFYEIQLSTLCLSYAVNMLLSAPLLLAMTRSPSMLGKLRFLLLTHLLCCDNLQLLVLSTGAVLFTHWHGMRVSQCVILAAASQGCSIVQILLSAALAVDRCVAIKWPLRYELLMPPSRRRAVVACSWAASLLTVSVGLYLALSSVQINSTLPRCRTLVIAHCLTGALGLWIFCTVVSALLLPGCYLTTLGCFLLLAWDVRGLLRSRRAALTLALQAVQMLFYSVPLLLNSHLLPSRLQCDALDIAAGNFYSLGVSLIPLVYGYHSRELQRRLVQAPLRNNIIPE